MNYIRGATIVRIKANFTILFALFIFMVFAHGSPAMAFGDECENKYPFPKAKSLNELISQSEFIGLYTAKSVEEVPGMETGGHYQAQMYVNHLKLAKPLTKNAPEELEVYGATPALKQIPDHYFFIKDIHKEMIERNLVVGYNAGEITMPDGSCYISPILFTGYEYLVFSGANSTFSYEPILHRKYDPLYIEVVKRIRAKKKAAQPPKK